MTNDMKKVLIALDYDPSSIEVAEKGHALAQMMGAEVLLIHVLSQPVYYSSVDYPPIMSFNISMNMDAYQTATVPGLKKAALHFLDRTKDKLHDDKIKTLLLEGDTADSIMEFAKKMNVDIIVLGTHSRKWFENILLGSVAESVLKQSTIPLFIVPIRNKEKHRIN